MKALASYIMRGRFQALLVAVSTGALMWLVPPFTTIIGELLLGAVVGLVTLRNGLRDGALLLLGTGLVVAVLATVAVQQGMMAAAMTGAVVLPIIPVWGLAHVLRRTVSWGTTLSVAAAVGALIVLFTYVATGDPTAFWQARLNTMVDGLTEAMSGADDAAAVVSPEMEQAVVALRHASEALAPWMTGLFAVSMLTVFIASLMVARWWQAQLYNPGGWRDEFYALRLPKVLAIATGGLVVVAAVMSGMPAQLAADWLFVAMAVYLFPGLAIVHGWVRGQTYAMPALAAVYVLLLIIPHVSVLVAGVGWLDSWVNVRRRAVT